MALQTTALPVPGRGTRDCAPQHPGIVAAHRTAKARRASGACGTCHCRCGFGRPLVLSVGNLRALEPSHAGAAAPGPPCVPVLDTALRGHPCVGMGKKGDAQLPGIRAFESWLSSMCTRHRGRPHQAALTRRYSGLIGIEPGVSNMTRICALALAAVFLGASLAASADESQSPTTVADVRCVVVGLISANHDSNGAALLTFYFLGRIDDRELLPSIFRRQCLRRSTSCRRLILAPRASDAARNSGDARSTWLTLRKNSKIRLRRRSDCRRIQNLARAQDVSPCNTWAIVRCRSRRPLMPCDRPPTERPGRIEFDWRGGRAPWLVREFAGGSELQRAHPFNARLPTWTGDRLC